RNGDDGRGDREPGEAGERARGSWGRRGLHGRRVACRSCESSSAPRRRREEVAPQAGGRAVPESVTELVIAEQRELVGAKRRKGLVARGPHLRGGRED